MQKSDNYQQKHHINICILEHNTDKLNKLLSPVHDGKMFCHLDDALHSSSLHGCKQERNEHGGVWTWHKQGNYKQEKVSYQPRQSEELVPEIGPTHTEQKAGLKVMPLTGPRYTRLHQAAPGYN